MREMFGGTVTWKGLEWIREEWGLPDRSQGHASRRHGPARPPTTGRTPGELASLVVQFFARLHAAGVARVAIERGDGPVVEELLAAGVAVFVVPSRQIKGLRTRYGSAGKQGRPVRRLVLADSGALRPDTEPTRALRVLCRSRKDLVETRVQVLTQLRANLELAFPGAIGLFAKPASGISLAFLQRFPTAAKAAWLSPGRLRSWLRSAGYTGGISAEVLHGRLAAAAPGLTGPEGEARGQITLALVAMLSALNAQITVLDAEIGRAFAAHPDRHIFASLPRSGTIRAASLLAEIGDCRQRFPTDEALAALAGACPRRASLASAARLCSAGRAARSCAPP